VKKVNNLESWVVGLVVIPPVMLAFSYIILRVDLSIVAACKYMAIGILVSAALGILTTGVFDKLDGSNQPKHGQL